ncbi:hypothetical protein PISMIDRAFT_687048 [Pisolithus microcarpus 441]|uniref:Fe2OG dioxygenase domain-containing protein n=1 Tax=Pisolithus microcarpus 441 TaxID=765257 RepID=A0A0C9Z012_9AGAM|nr:hypothetical protein PISMIDRAFT_687048 [Pisolithus microcarpus 441]
MVYDRKNYQVLSKLCNSVDSSLSSRPPYCAGTCPIPPEKLVLFYGNDSSKVSRIDFSSPTPEELDSLSNACQPASFGVNHERVHHESYRKAGEMNIASFATRFSARNAGLILTVRQELLDCNENRDIKVELYKLNVYGKDSFFKAHKDTPRHETMFGSLVVIFPTHHEGGEFVLREGYREWSLDFAKMLSDSPHRPCVGYVAFFSDVEHEVRQVTSGHRVTLTYNLYLTPESQAPIKTISAPAPYEGSLAAPLYTLLTDPTVLPKGGYLAFGLRRHYPLGEGINVTNYKTCLTGTDAALGRVLTTLGVDWNVMVFYRNVGSYNDYMSEEVVNLSKEPHDIYDFDEAMGEAAVLVEFASVDGIPRVRRHPNAETPPRHFAKVTVDTMTCWSSPYVMSGHYKAEVGELNAEVYIVVDLQEPVKRVVRKADSMEVGA